MLRRRGAVLVAPLFLIAACGDDDGGQQVDAASTEAAIAALSAAPDAAAEAGSARFEMTMAFDADGESFEMLATGAYDGDQMQMEIDLGEMFAGMLPSESVPDGMDEPMQMVFDGGTIYMRIPMLSALMGTDGWLSATPEDLGQAGDLFGAGALGAGASDPSQLLETLRGVSDDVEVVGEAEVRGVETTEYRATIDMDKALAAMPEDAQAAFEDQLQGAELAPMPVGIWLDDDGLVRRMTMDVGAMMAGVAEMAGSEGAVTIELFDYGADVEITVPDPDEVRPFSDLMGGMGGLGGAGSFG